MNIVGVAARASASDFAVADIVQLIGKGLAQHFGVIEPVALAGGDLSQVVIFVFPIAAVLGGDPVALVGVVGKGFWGQPSKLKFQALRLIFETARFDIWSIILNLGIKYFELTR